MLSIARMNQGPDYYLNLATEDYYLKGGEPPGRWFGRGTADPRINVSGIVKPGHLKNLLHRYSPEGNAPLTQIQEHEGKQSRQGDDLTFTSCKSFSTLWSQADETQRHVLQRIHATAVRTALRYLEDNACFVRRGKGGTELEKAKAIIAIFPHGTSRRADPGYHSHCLWMQVAIGAFGRPGTIESHMLFKHKMAAGAIFRATETELLKKRFGLEIERDKSCYRIKGVSKDLEVEFSKRSEEIKARLKKQGTSGAKAAAEATLKTRRKKEQVPRETLLRRWKETGVELGWGPEQARELFRKGQERGRDMYEDHSFWEEEVMKEALTKLTHQQSSFMKRDVVRFLAGESQVKGIGAKRVLELCEKALARKEVVPLGELEHEKRFTTKELLGIEEKMMERVSKMASSTSHEVREEVLSAVIASRPQMNEEQKSALRFATRGNAIVLIEGAAGTGKTTGFLDPLREAYEREGYTVLGAALAGVAADGLKAGANIEESRTVTRLLLDLKPRKGGDGEAAPKPRITLTERTLLILDEAPMIGSRQLAQLIEGVHRAGGKIALCGDSRQLPSIEAGGAFAAIRDAIGTSRLTKVVRQREEWMKEAARAFSEGRAEEGLKFFHEHSLLHVSETRRDAIEQLVSDWKALTKSQQERLIFCGTNVDAVTINRLCQQARLEAGELGSREMQVANEVFHVGDRVLFTKNSSELSVRNGNLGTVVGINLLRNQLSVELDGGKVVNVPILVYPHIKLGYCVTTHKGQGKTVEEALVLLGGSMQDREISYVQTTRSRGETSLYCDTEDGELRDLIRQMGKSREKELATTTMKKASLRQEM